MGRRPAHRNPETYRRALEWHLTSYPGLLRQLRETTGGVEGFLRALLENDDPALNRILRLLSELEDEADPHLRMRRRHKEETDTEWGLTWKPDFQPDPPEEKRFEQFRTRAHCPTVEEARVSAERWASGAAQPVLTLSGPPGTGKSHLAKAAYWGITSRGQTVFYISEGQLLEEFHRWVARKQIDILMRDLIEVPWLILDDLGTQAMGEWAQGIYDHLINARHESAGANRFMVTTNLLAKDIQPRVASRIGDRMKAIVVSIEAPDYRRQGF